MLPRRALAAAIVACALGVGCDFFCPGGRTVNGSYLFDWASGGKIIAPPELHLDPKLPRESPFFCGDGLGPDIGGSGANTTIECMNAPSSCHRPCFAIAVTHLGMLWLAFAPSDVPLGQTIALPDPRVRTAVRLSPDPSHGVTRSAEVVGGSFALMVSLNNFDARFSLRIAVQGGQEIRIEDGRYAQVNGHTEQECQSSD